MDAAGQELTVDDRFAGRADGFDEHYTEPRGRVRLDLVLERLNGVLPPPPARILDAGGGTGAFAIPLARVGYNVTVVDQSADWLEYARSKADAAGVDLDLVNIGLESLIDAGLGRFDAILCHAVLMYVEDPAVVLRQLLSAAAPGAVLSLLEKNRDGIALRPGLQGDYAEARRLLTERDSAGRLGVESRAYAVSEWLAMLHDAGWEPGDWVGIRLSSRTTLPTSSVPMRTPRSSTWNAPRALSIRFAKSRAWCTSSRLRRWTALEGDDARGRRREPTGIKVERSQLFVEVDVQPLTPGGAGLIDGKGDHLGADPMTPGSRRDERVDDEGVCRSVPRYVDEADELLAVSSTDPAQAAPIELTLPVIVKEAMAEALGVQGVDFGVLELTAPLVVDLHSPRIGQPWPR